jgi:hypothetical protein
MSYQCPRPCENKTQYGYCKTTYCINPQFRNLGTWQQAILQHGTLKLKQQTNADKIRSMSDEELASLFTQDVFDGEPCFYCPVNSEDCDLSTDCKKCFLDWLKQEVKT